jgi:signal peptidase I
MLNKETLASAWFRFSAFSLDVFIISLALFVVFEVTYSSIFSFSGDLFHHYFGLLNLIGIGIWVVYFSYLNSDGRQTLGKRWMKLQVCKVNGMTPSLGRCFLRTLCYGFSASIVFLGIFLAVQFWEIETLSSIGILIKLLGSSLCLLGCILLGIWIPFSPNRQSWHDVVCATLVKKIGRLSKKRLYSSFILSPIFLCIPLLLTIFVQNQLGITKVLSDGMEPTLKRGDHVIFAIIHPLFFKPSRGDIVLLKTVEHPKKLMIKRIVGLSEEKILIKKKQVFINDKRISLKNVIDSKNRKFFVIIPQRDDWEKPYLIPRDMYFVLGDNWDNSFDSRFWGGIPKENILAKAIGVYWPLSRIKLLKNSL